ncbi:hypothetical protein M0805_006212 [Coniferiporia weirii]|nr:hypothetical protein M0805_006212 [Coniferiporia weirii]
MVASTTASSSAETGSLASVSSISTNATAPNLPGPGRTVGRGYDFLGQRLVSLLTRALKTKKSPSGSSHPSASPQGREPSVDSKLTAPNLAGAGRTLGLAYDFFGVRLERRLTGLALKGGFGPDGASDRIRLRMHSVNADAVLGDASDDYEAYLRECAVDVLLADEACVRYCRRLLKYARTDNNTNQSRALDNIMTLAVEYPLFRIVFSRLGGIDVLHALSLRLRRYNTTGSRNDPLLAWSRKALISVTEIKVNTLGHGLRPPPIIGSPARLDEGQETSIAEITKFFSNPETLFIAVRHVQHKLFTALRSFNHPIMFYCVDKLAEAALTMDSDDLEWIHIDRVFLFFLMANLPISVGKRIETEHIATWAKILQVIFRNPDKVEFSLSILCEWTGRYEKILDHTATVASANEAAVRTNVLVTILTGNGLISPSFSLNGYLRAIQSLARLFNHEKLTKFWENMSSGTIITVARAFLGLTPETNFTTADLVVGDELRESVCRDMVKCLVSSPSGTRERTLATKGIGVLLTFDRYFLRSTGAALEQATLSRGTRGHKMRMREDAPGVAREMWDVALSRYVNSAEPILSPPKFRVENPYIYRHRSTDNGRTHVRTHEAFSAESPCAACQKMGIWYDWLAGPSPTCERLWSVSFSEGSFWAIGDTKRAVPLEAQSPFDASLHHGILAGTDDLGRSEYIVAAELRSKRGVPGSATRYAVGTVTDGATQALYFEKDLLGLKGGELERDPSMMEVVLVLRFDPSPAVEDRVRANCGVDVTSHFFWRDAEYDHQK